MTMPPASSRVGLFVGIAAAAVMIIAAGAFYMIRSAQKNADLAAREAKTQEGRAAKAIAAAKAEEEESPVFLSVVSDPLEADVIATWKDGGEKRGPAPLGFEVPKNSKVHFAFTKAGFVGYEMDVIADQSQNVKAQLKATAAEKPAEKKPPHLKGGKKPEEKKPDAPPSKDGLIDLDDALK